MGLKPEERVWWSQGKKAHAIIQAHVSGKTTDPRLAHIKFTFPIVEERDFDKRCKFDFDVRGCLTVHTPKTLEDEKFLMRGEYNLIGFYDGLDYKNNRFLEIKSSDPLWSVGKFQKAMQRKIYALADPLLSEAILITCSKNPDNWVKQPAKIFKVPLTDQDREEASDWITKAIELLEKGNFTGGLEDSVCTDPYCYFGCNCSFK